MPVQLVSPGDVLMPLHDETFGPVLPDPEYGVFWLWMHFPATALVVTVAPPGELSVTFALLETVLPDTVTAPALSPTFRLSPIFVSVMVTAPELPFTTRPWVTT